MKNQNLSMQRLSKKFLTQISNSINKDQVLDTLIEAIENKIDPHPSELFLLESLYNLKEKIRITESRITNYLKNELDQPTESKLNELYMNSVKNGSSKLFNY